ncbi:hypothetical protein [Blautia sp. HCP28S3_G10]|uniref:hypothetical protein n=1 Tax=Blautia sp. HCP28S3_G10 TaxID=3438908 RepID=UPI003F8CBD16
MEMKNICGRIPVELHAKVRGEIEQRGISTPEFLQQVIEEHFMEKGVDQMAARTIAVQVTEELFGRLKAVVAWKGCKQKDFLISIIEKAVREIEDEQENARREREIAASQQEDAEGAEEEPEGIEEEPEGAGEEPEETEEEPETGEVEVTEESEAVLPDGKPEDTGAELDEPEGNDEGEELVGA